jgi:nuclear pore complex protein Nup98-Nup96
LTLGIQLKHTEFEIDSSGCPYAKTQPTLTFDEFVMGIHAAAALDAPLVKRHEDLVWRLCRALFDPLPHSADDDARDAGYRERLERQLRKNRLISWLREAVEPTACEEAQRYLAEGKPTAAVFAFMSGLQVDKACMTAIQNSEFRLATLLPQAGGSEEFRAEICEQLERWWEYDCESLISPEHRRIYELLSGNAYVSLNAKSPIRKRMHL